MVTLAGFASNRGRNLRNLDDLEPGGATLGVVVSNHADAPILEAARERGIETVAVERGETDSRREHEDRILAALEGHAFDLVCMDGYMRILTRAMLDHLPPVLNVHPSLLPAFPGDDAWGDALEAGVRVSGCTVHVATEEVDAGPIITQEPIPVRPGDTVETLKHRILYEGEFKAYPRAVRWFAEGRVEVSEDRRSATVEPAPDDDFPELDLVGGDRVDTLRYGENPHQSAAVYADVTDDAWSIAEARERNPNAKALSYNNVHDVDAAYRAAIEFDRTACAVIKHANPAGVATADSAALAYERALSTDPMSAFGGIVALNVPCDRETAMAITDSFKDAVVAPGYTDAALAELRTKESLRVLEVPERDRDPSPLLRSVLGGHLVQDRDHLGLAVDDLEVVTEAEPTAAQARTMAFAWGVAKHAASNAIVLATGTETVGIGQGQVSRVDAVELAVRKAREHAEGKGPEGAVLASDGFFPFPDGIEAAADAGVEAVVQPGGSRNDDAVIDAADERGLAMAFTGRRCFRH
ncbi:MAG: phosphoribosylglycinamide formyltransferase [Halobacteriales archaeon]